MSSRNQGLRSCAGKALPQLSPVWETLSGFLSLATSSLVHSSKARQSVHHTVSFPYWKVLGKSGLLICSWETSGVQVLYNGCTIIKNAAGAPILSMKQMNALHIYKHGSRPASWINKIQQITAVDFSHNLNPPHWASQVGGLLSGRNTSNSSKPVYGRQNRNPRVVTDGSSAVHL